MLSAFIVTPFVCGGLLVKGLERKGCMRIARG
ncbi:hypothetical protein I314_05346 [Cryptococcus bacillisporus CA1873]|uniref:Unplaced genomic scaffold supercont1.13, whole genome shotgun sequence n=2 Tax=Cryptococcus gattii TaxID=552467 RepID=A0A0D0VHS6_CRYGA|nr:hypothetical protein I312_04581 [Cryptococcus bacillisporus CA1280]KIR58932.1 hypothetical protein I314_05346 [Cryptococcus bacillisporus CA1873]KIR84907.1 hypothetical protein I308_04656 [Cryptococcus tetragattii IND107]|eukprot:KIR58932.1 hypothetical protein I314_05346 [Cryptococcus gattii CA1873]